jgi:GNAT superfamily N-acetyltransferase
MDIREATPEDIPAIVEVLKASLGESDLPLSKDIWNFKHVHNPFGKSIVLVAVEGNNLAGVRAFMRWQWQKADRTYSCYRAVDTATHPKYQGKGIFKKLTLKAVELAKEEGGDFIFNTPNEMSRPGYFKMGWMEAGKLDVAISFHFFSFLKLWNSGIDYKITYKTSVDTIEALCQNWNKNFENESLYTAKSAGYLHWRYEKNPLQQYEVLATSDFYLAGYIKKRQKLKELRIVECIKKSRKADKEIKASIGKWASKFGAQFISYSPGITDCKLFSVKGKFGPLATVRNLNLKESEKDVLNVDKWQYSLGDLELF